MQDFLEEKFSLAKEVSLRDIKCMDTFIVDNKILSMNNKSIDDLIDELRDSPMKLDNFVIRLNFKDYIQYSLIHAEPEMNRFFVYNYRFNRNSCLKDMRFYNEFIAIIDFDDECINSIYGERLITYDSILIEMLFLAFKNKIGFKSNVPFFANDFIENINRPIISDIIKNRICFVRQGLKYDFFQEAIDIHIKDGIIRNICACLTYINKVLSYEKNHVFHDLTESNITFKEDEMKVRTYTVNLSNNLDFVTKHQDIADIVHKRNFTRHVGSWSVKGHCRTSKYGKEFYVRPHIRGHGKFSKKEIIIT